MMWTSGACQEFCVLRSCEDMNQRNSHDRREERRHTANSEQQNILRITDRPIAEPSTEQRCGVAVRRNGTGRSTEETVGGAMLEAELSHHLKQQNAQGKTDNHRNGSSAKTVITPAGD